VPDYKWNPIEPLSDVDKQIDIAGTRSLYESWRAAKQMEATAFANTNPSEVAAAFTRWLDHALAVALKEFGDRL
jgi:hypothetical protein